ncbi:MAG: hypothetical protein KIT87_13930 [Anaerolineae bacterium]|nr:hypothetical protein [Anaerolineae bacterium]
MTRSRACRLIVSAGVVAALLALWTTLMTSAAPALVDESETRTSLPYLPHALQPTNCLQSMINGGFETSDAWRIATTPQPATYTVERVRSGGRALKLGIEPPTGDAYSHSSASQSVTIPAVVSRATLVFWTWRGTEEAGWTTTETSPLAWTSARDGQEVLVLDRRAQPLAVLLRGAVNDGDWTRYEYDLTPFRGQTIALYFNVLNNGTGGKRSWMYIDDVSLEVCRGTEPPPAPTPSPPVTHGEGCGEGLLNGGFESSAVWQRPVTPFRADFSLDDRHSGQRSMRLGVPPADVDRYGHSAAYQAITIPASATRAILSFWVKRRTQAEETPAVAGTATPPATIVQGVSSRAASEDYQEALVLDHDYTPLLTLFRSRVNSPDWERWRINLLPYRGQRVVVYFNAFNDGDGRRTWLSVDDVALDICGADGGAPVGGRGQVTLQGRADYSGVVVGLVREGMTTTEPLACYETGPTGAFQCEVTADEAAGGRLTASHSGYLRSEIPLTANLLTQATRVELVAGDVNGDCQINLADLVIVSDALGSQRPEDRRADVNGNGVVDVTDVVLVAMNYNRRCPTPWQPAADENAISP